MLKNYLLLSLLFSVAFLSVAAQETDDEKLKEAERRKLAFVEQILGDAQNLRLPENRAYVFAKAAGSIWQADEKRARELFRNAVGELIAAQTAVENEKRNRQFYQTLLYGQSPRWDILWLIAARDAEYALEAQKLSRPNALAAALENYAETQRYSNVSQFVKNELSYEQRLISLAAEQNPQRAEKLLRESLKKSISYETLNLLRTIHQKNPALGVKLAEETGELLLSRDLSKNHETINVLSNFLGEFEAKGADEKGLQISEKLTRDLAAKMLDFWLDAKTDSFQGNLSLPVFEKYFPERLAKAKQKFEAANQRNRPKEYEEYDKLIESNPSGEELLNRASKFPENFQQQILQNAAYKFAEAGDVGQAGKLIKQIYPDQADSYISQWQYNSAMKAVSQDNFDEANNLINEIVNDDTKINALIYLASVVYQKDPKENKNRALSILDQARGVLPDEPETYNEINSLINLAAQYAAIEPARAFPLIESLIPQLDELSQAQAVIARHQPNNGAIRSGEFQIRSGGFISGAQNLTNVLRTLKQSDEARVLQITRGFSRLDARLSIQIEIVENDFLLTNYPRRRGFGFVID